MTTVTSPPYDENTIYGYFLSQLLTLLVIHAFAAILTASLGFFLGGCDYLDAFCADHVSVLNKCDEITSSDRMPIKLVIEQQILQNLRFHVKILK